MKLTGSAERISVKSLLILLIAGAGALVPLRCYQMFAVVEGGTGFWVSQNFTIPLFYSLLAAVVALSVTMSFLSGGITKTYSKKPDTLVGVFSLVFSLSLIIDAATSFWNFFSIVIDWKEFAPSGYSQLSFLLRSSSFALPIQAVFAVLSALYFMMFGLYYLNKIQSMNEYKVLAVMPVFWLVMQLVYRFARTINFMNVSELLLELFLLVSMMIFLLNFSRSISEVGNKEGFRTAFAAGIPAAVLGFLCSIPRLILVITGKSANLTNNSPFTFWHLAAALFIIVCLYRLFNVEDEDTSEETGDNNVQVIPQSDAVVVERSDDYKNVKEPESPKVAAPVVEKFSMEALENNIPAKKEPEKKQSSPKVAAPVVEKFSMEALENNTPAKKEPEKKQSSPKVAAPVVEKFSMEALENNAPAKKEPEKKQSSPKVAAPVVEKFSMEALENNIPAKKEPEKKQSSPKVAAPVVEKFSMEAFENNTPVKKKPQNEANEDRFSLEAFINSDAYEKDEEPQEEEIEHFDLGAFLANLKAEEGSEE